MSARAQNSIPTEEEVRAAFSPEQARIVLALISTPPEKYLSMAEAAEMVGWTYSTFRKEPAFDRANVAPPGMRKRYARSKLLRIATALREGVGLAKARLF